MSVKRTLCKKGEKYNSNKISLRSLSHKTHSMNFEIILSTQNEENVKSTNLLVGSQYTVSQMQEYGGVSSKSNEYRDPNEVRERQQDGVHNQQYTLISQKSYGCSNKELIDQNITTYCRVTTGIYESSSNQQYHNPRYNNPSAPTFSSPPNSPLVGLVFDPSSSNFGGHGVMADRLTADRRSQSTWSISNQEPIGTGIRKKIVKSNDKRNAYSADPRYHEKFKDNTEIDRQRKQDINLTAESTSSLDFFVEGERMVSELCNISESISRCDASNQKQNQKTDNLNDDKHKVSISSDLLLTALDKIVIHDQIPNQIVQLAIEACTDAENIAIAHHNRPCFKNIHSICAKTRSNVQKSDSAVANLHSQGIPWVIKNFIFSFVRILDGWKGVKELLSEKHDTFSRIENKYYSPNIRECFIQWQAVTKEMLTHIYKTFKCLDHGFTLEQKSFTHNYYATNPAGPRHQNQNKFQPVKPHIGTPRTINATPQPYNAIQPPWIQNQSQALSQSFNESPWPSRSGATYKKFPVVPPSNPHNFYPLSDQNDIDSYQQKLSYKCEPCSVREAKPRQSWTITNVPDFRALENMCHADQRELYNQLKHKMDAELGKAPGQTILGNVPCDLIQRREMELKAKMIPLSHVEKALIPSMATASELRGCLQKNNSCGDTKEETDFFATWGQVIQKEPNDFLTHHSHNIQIPSNVVTISNISGPVQFIEPDNDEFHEISKAYMKPGSYKVPIKPTDPVSPFLQSPQDAPFDNSAEDTTHLKIKTQFPQVTLAPQPKYNIESWPCLMSRRNDDSFDEDQKMFTRSGIRQMTGKGTESLDLFGSMTPDNAWEAAKQSAPKLMDFLHEGSKSDTARLYDALCLSTTDDITESIKNIQSASDNNEVWSSLSSNRFMAKQSIDVWQEESATKQDPMHAEGLERQISSDNTSKSDDVVNISLDVDDQTSDNKRDECKESSRCYDQTGSFVKDDTIKKSSSKSKTVSGMWYHPKKKKPLAPATVKKFETILSSMYQINEAKFVMDDMDIKVAPRFYEVVKRPMCLHDISTKLKNSAYTEYDQVVQDFRRIFNNVRLYLKSFPDAAMKRNVNKISTEFEKMLNDEFQNKSEPRIKSQDNITSCDAAHKKYDKEIDKQKSELKSEEITKINEDSKK